MKETIKKNLLSHIEAATKIFDQIETIQEISKECIRTIENGGKLILFGNGGSAADSQHIAAELVGRYKKDRKALPAFSLTTDTSILTAVANDYSFDYIYQRQLETLLNPFDLVICISTSGKSKNVINAVEYAKNCKNVIIGLTGSNGGDLEKFCDICFKVESSDTPRIQEMHILVGHEICNLLDLHFCEK